MIGPIISKKARSGRVGVRSVSFAVLALCVGCTSITANRGGIAKESASGEAPSRLTARFVAEHCAICHGEKLHEADLNLVTHASLPVTLANEAVWERVLDMLRRGDMPPEDRPQPDSDDVEAIVVEIDAALERVAQSLAPDPGRVTTRRLNRAEYSNTIRDLLGVTYDATKDFPPDDSGYGFDTIGDVLTVSPLLMEKYFSAAERIAAEAVVVGPSNEEDFAAKYARVFVCGHEFGEHNAACARNVLRPLAREAYRRPVTRREANNLVAFVELVQDDGGSFEEGIRLAVEALLVSPHFLFRVERDRAPSDSSAAHKVNPFELATRLSYFLWSTMPDQELMQLADEGGLRNPEVLEAQVKRMLADEKSKGLVDNFAGQWLELRNLRLAYRDPETFPDFDRELRRAMERETQLFFTTILSEDRSLLEFLDADYTFLNERLAKHYGIAGVEGENFRRVSLEGDQRGGLLAQGSFLTLTAHATRTSPVLRGLWVLENILGTPPPPPPPDVPPLPTQEGTIQGTMRERMEQHRADPTCASCHSRMDPIGFGLENYDAIGRWRTTEGEVAIDSSGTLPTGEAFSGPKELKALLLAQKDAFTHTLTKKMLTYALGRGLERYDRPAVDSIARAVAEDDYRFSRLVLEIVESMPFQMRRGDDGGKA